MCSNVGHVEHGCEKAVLPVKACVADGAKVERSVAECSATPAKAPLAAARIQATGWRLERDRFPLRALVVQDVAGREFSQCEQPGTRDEFPLVARHPGPDRKRGKVVTG